MIALQSPPHLDCVSRWTVGLRIAIKLDYFYTPRRENPVAGRLCRTASRSPECAAEAPPIRIQGAHACVVHAWLTHGRDGGNR